MAANNQTEASSPGQIKSSIRKYLDAGKRLFVSSSFQTHSIPLLHMVSQASREIPVIFLNTGFLFPETLEFRDAIADRLGLQLINLRSDIPKSQQLDSAGNFFYTSDVDRCCEMNKTAPMEKLLQTHDVWINGVRADQSEFRKSIDVEQATPFRCIRFHPMLGWTARMIYEYRIEHDLPEHPLEAQGYFSIGCEPCTRKWGECGRDGRWQGMQKTECGLHTQLIQDPDSP